MTFNNFLKDQIFNSSCLIFLFQDMICRLLLDATQNIWVKNHCPTGPLLLISAKFVEGKFTKSFFLQIWLFLGCAYLRQPHKSVIFVFSSFCCGLYQHSILLSDLLCGHVNARTVWPEPIWIKVSGWWQIPPQHQSTYLRGPESASIEIPPFRPKFT